MSASAIVLALQAGAQAFAPAGAQPERSGLAEFAHAAGLHFGAHPTLADTAVHAAPFWHNPSFAAAIAGGVILFYVLWARHRGSRIAAGEPSMLDQAAENKLRSLETELGNTVPFPKLPHAGVAGHNFTLDPANAVISPEHCLMRGIPVNYLLDEQARHELLFGLVHAATGQQFPTLSAFNAHFDVHCTTRPDGVRYLPHPEHADRPLLTELRGTGRAGAAHELHPGGYVFRLGDRHCAFAPTVSESGAKGLAVLVSHRQPVDRQMRLVSGPWWSRQHGAESILNGRHLDAHHPAERPYLGHWSAPAC